MITLGVLGSGKGSNFLAILDAIKSGDLDARVGIVLSDDPDAGILGHAQSAGIPTAVINEPKFRTRLSEEVEHGVARRLMDSGVEWVVLAGFMRMIKSPLLNAFPGRMINIHPSLLPDFPGLEAWKQALDAGVTESGCTVHLVDAGMDTGPILGQARVPVRPADTPESLHARIQEAEHRLLPGILARLAAETR